MSAAGFTSMMLMVAAATPPTTVFMMPVEPKNDASPDMAEQLGSLLAVELAQQPDVKLLTYKDAEAMLNLEARAQLLDCDTQSCAAELAGALNSDEVIFGSVGLIGAEYLLTITRLRVKSAVVLARVAEPFTAETATAMIDVIRKVVGALMAKPQAPAVETPKPPVTPAAAAPNLAPSLAPTPAPVVAATVVTEEHAALGVAQVMGGAALYAAGLVPLVLIGTLVMAGLFVSSPVGMLVAVYLGVVAGALSASDKSIESERAVTAGLLSAFLVFPGAWAAAGLVALGAVMSAHLVWPVFGRALAKLMGRPSAGLFRWWMAALVGAGVGAVGLLPAVVSLASGSALLLSLVVLFNSPEAANAAGVQGNDRAVYIFAGGLLLCAVAFPLAALAVVAAGASSLGASVPLFATATAE